MYCKKCGKEIPDDSVFCLYCGTNLKESITESPKTEEPIKVDVNANVKAQIAPSVNLGWYKKLTSNQKNWLCVYCVWFVIHLILLVSGEGRDKFFPHIYKGRNITEAHLERLRTYGSAPAPPEEWMIKWNIDYYGLPEFLIYVVLIPLVIYFIYKIFSTQKSIGKQ